MEATDHDETIWKRFICRTVAHLHIVSRDSNCEDSDRASRENA